MRCDSNSTERLKLAARNASGDLSIPAPRDGDRSRRCANRLDAAVAPSSALD